MILNSTEPGNQKVYEVGFLVLLLLMVIIQFIIFYFFLPEVTADMPKEEGTAVSQSAT